jgi:hypothetical protein
MAGVIAQRAVCNGFTPNMIEMIIAGRLLHGLQLWWMHVCPNTFEMYKL